MMDNFFVESDGLQIAVEIVGEGRPLIWAHGLSGWRQSGINKFRHLADHYQIIAFDQRGHNGSSPVTDPALYDPALMAGDIAAILDELGIERAIIGGESMGAATALTFARQWPERVETLLLIAPAFGDAPNAQEDIIRANGELIANEGMDAFLAKTAVEQREMGMSEELMAYLEEVRRSHDPASLATAFQTVIDWQLFDDLAVLSDLDVPVYLIAWPDDPLHPMELAVRMTVAFPNACLQSVPSIAEFFLNPAGLGDMCHAYLTDLEASHS
ncbi:MAG: alpha/beta hydrolase [Chloroflexi bacterium]|nr:alpha/beta hydrolase [Chloroflexota bacterium]